MADAEFDEHGFPSKDVLYNSDGAPVIAGWSPPLILDYSAGVTRLATQADVDDLMADRARLARFISMLRAELSSHDHD